LNPMGQRAQKEKEKEKRQAKKVVACRITAKKREGKLGWFQA